VAGLIGICFFLVWFGIITAGWVIYNNLRPGTTSDLWNALEGISSAATLATMIGGGLMALVQLREAADNRRLALESRNMEVYDNVFERMMCDEEIEARRWIYTPGNLVGDPEQGLTLLDDVGQEHVKRVLNSFDHLGFLIQQDWVTDDAVVRWVNPIVVKVWDRLGPYVEYEAERRNEPDYYEAARELAIRCAEWRIKHVPGAKITWVENAL
jgi:hypothetical protein